MTSVRIKDITPRLAFQSFDAPTTVKVETIDRLSAAGVPAIEATSFVRPDLVPGLADAAEVMGRVRRPDGARFECCVGNERGLRAAADAGMDGAWFLLSADEQFAMDNIGQGLEDSMRRLAGLAEVASRLDVELGTYVIFTWGGPVGAPRDGAAFESIGRRLLDLGVTDWILADSAGYAAPPQVRDVLDHAVALVGAEHVSVQVHDARGMGLANVAAMLDAGVTRIDTSLGGSGGHPALRGTAGGGLCTEDLVQMLDLSGVRTGVDLEAVVDTANWLADEVGLPMQGFVRRSGSVAGRTDAAGTDFRWAAS